MSSTGLFCRMLLEELGKGVLISTLTDFLGQLEQDFETLFL